MKISMLTAFWGLLFFALYGGFVFAEEKSVVNETCPVMKGERVDKELYVDYKGKRVYFCCRTCVDAFNADPEKYVKDLPQFRGKSVADGHERHSHEAEGGFHAYKLVKPLGVATLVSLLLTAFCGLFRKRNPVFLLKWHKRFACLTVVFALGHFFLITFAF